MTSFRFPVTITSTFERKVQKHLGGAGQQAVFSTDSAGWYVRLDDYIALHVGAAKPNIADGTEYELILRPKPDPQAG